MDEGAAQGRAEAAQDRLAGLLEQVGVSEGRLRAGSEDALEQLAAALEELRTAGEELRQQNDELALARGVIESERERYLDLFENGPDAYLVTNLSGVVLEANTPADALLQVPHQSLIGKPLVLFVAEAERLAFHALLAQMQEGCGPRRFELTMQARGGHGFAAATMVAPVCDAQGTAQSFRWTIRDITPGKQAEQRLLQQQDELRDLASDLVLAEEHARRALALGIHDEMSQPLAFLQLKLGLAKQAVADEGTRQQLADAERVLKQVIETSRTLMFEASSPVLYELGFGAALEWLVEDVCARHGITAHFTAEGEPLPLTDDVKVLVFRGVRELLVRAAERAQVRNVHVYLAWLPNQVQITVSGDGVEVPLAAGGEESDHLLLAIRERLAHLGGRVAAESAGVSIAAPVRVGEPSPPGLLSQSRAPFGRYRA